MSDRDAQILGVLVASYGSIDDADVDLKAVRATYRQSGASCHLDAAVVSTSEKGRVRIEKTYQEARRHDALRGLGFGLAAGLVAAAFPAIGIAAAIGAGARGAAIGALVSHVQTGIPCEHLRQIGDLLEVSPAALIVVYDRSLADQVAMSIRAVNRMVSRIADLKAEQFGDGRQSHV